LETWNEAPREKNRLMDPRHESPQFRWKSNTNPKGHTWIDGEPITIDELHQSAGFTKRDPAYLLNKNKQKQARKK
jgi:hypothetical protein